jgi:peptidoglycan hydrolase CwlO-like protein
MKESGAGILAVCVVVITIIVIAIESTVSDFRNKFIDKDFQTNKMDQITGGLSDIRRQQERILKELREINERQKRNSEHGGDWE